MVDRRFPFATLGLVHVGNSVTVHRRLSADDVLDVACRPARLRAHRRGRLVDIDTTVTVDGEPVWEETTTLLSRGGGDRDAVDDSPLAGVDVPACDTRWELPADLGRRYAAVSGDHNPIHLSALSAKAFGFPRAIAHGMWTAARALAFVDARLPAAYRYDVSPAPAGAAARSGARGCGLRRRRLDHAGRHLVGHQADPPGRARPRSVSHADLSACGRMSSQVAASPLCHSADKSADAGQSGVSRSNTTELLERVSTRSVKTSGRE